MGLVDSTLYALDTPGALLRGVLAGKPGTRQTGREMLESWGALGPNREGMDGGDAAGFLADLLLDPVNWAGGFAVKGALKAGGRALTGRAAGRASSLAQHMARGAKAAQEPGAVARVGIAANAGEQAARLHPARMSLPEFTKRFNELDAKVLAAEKHGPLPKGLAPWSPEMDWRTWSQARGYTPEEIRDFEDWLTIAGHGKGFDYSDVRPEAIWRQHVASAASPAKGRHLVAVDPADLVTEADRKWIESKMHEGRKWLGHHYAKKWDPQAKNVVNPESGKRLFTDGITGAARIRRLRSGQVELGPGVMSPENLAEYVPEREVNMALGSKSLTVPAGGNVRYNTEAIRRLDSSRLADVGVHEFAHLLTDADKLIHPDTMMALGRASEAAYNVRANALRRGKPLRNLMPITDERRAYLQRPTEMLARIATTRRRAEKLPPDTVDKLLNDPLNAAVLSNDARDLVEAFGPRLTKYLLRVIPAVPLAAALGVGATRENPHA